MDTKIMKALYSVLSQFEEKYFISGDLNKSKVIEDIDKYDEKLVLALLNNPLVRKHYSKNLGEYTIIETNKLIETFEMDNFWMDSHTKYTKKIGLTSRGRFIDESTEVVLDFPYKDTVLKAGMTKDDVEKDDLKPDEPFYNEVIASEEIDVMLDKKIFVNAKRYSKDGLEVTSDFDWEEDNLILKGNNLLALHTIKDKYAGKVKMIYIDPPYNTGTDSFDYNDKYNHSTWLTFMKNRLEIAKQLLTKDGVIFVQCDDNENAYLKILMDEIFGIHNFINNISVKMSEMSGNKISHVRKRFSKLKESILLYKKSSEVEIDFNPISLIKEEWDSEYNKIFVNFSKRDKRKIDEFNKKVSSGYMIKEEDLKLIDNILSKVKISNINLEYSTKENDISFEDWLKENSFRIFRTAASSSVKKLVDIKRQTVHQDVFSVKSSRDGLLYIALSTYSENSKSPRVQILFAEDYLTTYLGDMWNDITSTGLEAEGKVNFKNGKKPEKLISRIIYFASKESDIVLDFFMGSATTQAVAMKMNRRFIGIEQMDYINTVSVPRLQNVIEGEQGGISKDVEWQGGGSFVYAELMEKSQGYIDQIYKAKDREELFKIYQLMLENVDMNFKVDLKALEEILKEEPSLVERKKLLLKVIDKNQLYYNYSEIDDVNVRDLISDTDYAFNQSFYKEDDIIG